MNSYSRRNLMYPIHAWQPEKEIGPKSRKSTADITADINKPINIDEAFSGEHSKEWKQATDSEFKS